MNVISPPDGTLHAFHCPACGRDHHFNHLWAFNGDYAKPTVTPSIKVQGVVPLTDDEADKVLRGEPFEPVRFVCHFFITDGKIAYCGDCTHAMKNMTVDLPEFSKKE